MEFNPIGAHVDGLAIDSAQVIPRPDGYAEGVAKLLAQTVTQNVRFTLDGTTPTATLGFQLVAGDPPIIIPSGPNTIITVIEEAATADFQFIWGV
jgi:membrane-associated protease RseP (regulator of RpoE activity)